MQSWTFSGTNGTKTFSLQERSTSSNAFSGKYYKTNKYNVGKKEWRENQQGRILIIWGMNPSNQVILVKTTSFTSQGDTKQTYLETDIKASKNQPKVTPPQLFQEERRLFESTSLLVP